MMDKVVIFGATGGMGSEIAHRLYEKKIELHLVGRDHKKTAALADELGAGYTTGDVNDPELFANVANDAGKTLGGLVYAVGTLNLKSIKRLTEDDFLNDFKVNAIGAALAVKHLLPALTSGQAPSSVVLFSSVAAEQGFTFHASIGMAKGAVRALTLSLAAELAPNVRVNAISPSLTDTPLAQPMLANEKLAEALSKQHPMERLGTPADMAGLCEFLLSNQSSWITGQIIGVDGGRSTLRTKK